MMPPMKALLAAAFAGLVLVACTEGGQPDISPQQREALSDEMLETDSLSGGYMPGMGIGTL